jgi:signal peptidase I
MKNIIYIFVIVGMSILSGCSVEKKEITALSTTSQPVIIEDTCQTEIIESDVRWVSMVPIYQDGDMIQYSSGYYRCHDVARNDIVIFDIAGKLIIKRVVWIPWDHWEYYSGTIIMNTLPLENTLWEIYHIESKMLDMYATSYPTIPNNTYMLLGNDRIGTHDSSKFWLIAKQDIVGKVIPKEIKE